MDRVSALALAVALSLACTTSARADDAPSTTPAPSLALSVAPGTQGGPWTLKVTNDGEMPLRLVADPHLLVLEVTPSGGTATTTCTLPDDARPKTDEGQELVVPAKRSWSATFDPYFYCFDAKARAALAPGALVRARFGWVPRPTKAKAKKPAAPEPPFVVSPIGASVGKIAPAKVIDAPAFTLTDAQRPTTTAPAAAEPPKEGEAPPTSGLALTASAALDAARGVELPITVTVTNESDRSQIVTFRPELIRFRVSGPAGTVSCGTTVERASPIRELFTTLAPRGRTSQTVLLTASCPVDTFDQPGLYRATAILDTSMASGRPIGLRSFDGVVTAKEPTLVRVRTPRRPTTATRRPALD